MFERVGHYATQSKQYVFDGANSLYTEASQTLSSICQNGSDRAFRAYTQGKNKAYAAYAYARDNPGQCALFAFATVATAALAAVAAHRMGYRNGFESGCARGYDFGHGMGSDLGFGLGHEAGYQEGVTNINANDGLS